MSQPTRDFKSTKAEVLLAIYSSLMSENSAEWLMVTEIFQILRETVPPIYLRKTVESLEGEGLLKTKRGRAGPAIYTISERGILVVEQQLASSTDDGISLVPAADRLVSIDHNGGPADAIVQQAKDLSEQLKTSNDVGEMSVDEVATAADEVTDIANAFSQNFIRPRRAWDLTKSTLKWIAEKGGSAAVGKAATALLTAVAAFFGIAL